MPLPAPSSTATKTDPPQLRLVESKPVRPLRIAFIGARGVIGTYSGIETYYEEVGARLAERGHSVTAYCRTHFTPPVKEHRGIRVRRLPSLRTKHLETVSHSLLSTIDCALRSFDIVQFHAIGSSPLALLPRLTGKKTVVSVRGLDWQRGKWGRTARSVLKFGEWASARCPSKTVVVSETLGRHYRAQHKVDARVIPNAVVREPKRPLQRLSELGLTEGGYLLFAGRISPEKQLHTLLEAAEPLLGEIKLVVAGGASYSDDYYERMRELGGEHTLFLGQVERDSMLELYSNCYAFVLPSTMEGLSIALLESLSFGNCIVASDIPENREVLGDAGRFFAVGDRDALRTQLGEPDPASRARHRAAPTCQRACRRAARLGRCGARNRSAVPGDGRRKRPLSTRGEPMTTRRRFLEQALRAGDVLVMAAAFAAALATSGLMSNTQLAEFLSIRIKLSNALMFGGFAMVWFFIFQAVGLYRSRRIGSLPSEWWDVFKATSAGSLLLPAVAMVLDLTAVDRAFIATFFAVAFFGTVLTRTLLRYFLGEARRKGRNLRNVIVIGCGPRGTRLAAELRTRPELGYQLLGFVDDIEPPELVKGAGREHRLGTLDEVDQVLRRYQVDEVLIALPLKSQYETIERTIASCEAQGIITRMPADFFQLEIARAEVDHLDQIPIMTLRPPTPSAGGLVFKRVFDLLTSGIGLFLLLPVFAMVAMAIKLDSRGPVLFSQDRIGFSRRPFRMWKFRTMIANAERLQTSLEVDNEVKGAAFKMETDPRVTRVGRFLRKSSIDELPQLWNVLVGDMSIVGPRPLPIRDVQAFDRPWLNRRFSVKPGLTCIWQANGRHNIEFDKWMELDLQYIDQWSLGLDFEIMMKTVPAVIKGTGAS